MNFPRLASCSCDEIKPTDLVTAPNLAYAASFPTAGARRTRYRIRIARRGSFPSETADADADAAVATSTVLPAHGWKKNMRWRNCAMTHCGSSRTRFDETLDWMLWESCR